MLDLLPTFAAVSGARTPTDRIIDGVDISPLLSGAHPAVAPRDTFFYYWKGQLEAVRFNKWKLHVAKHGETVLQLYDLENDCAEQHDVAALYPDVVTELQSKLSACRVDLGDDLHGLGRGGCAGG